MRKTTDRTLKLTRASLSADKTGKLTRASPSPDETNIQGRTDHQQVRAV